MVFFQNDFSSKYLRFLQNQYFLENIILKYFLVPFLAFFFSYNQINNLKCFNNHQIINQMIRLINLSCYGVKNIKQANSYQRRKYYSKYPNIFKAKSIIKPPDLTQPNITFPIHIPIRFRHIYKLTKQLFVDNSEKIKWDRLTPNEILLGFENIKYLSFEEVVEGLRTLSNVSGQQNHNWNQHQWVNSAFVFFRQNFIRIKKGEHIQLFYLMRKLNNKDEEMWKKMYQRLQLDMYQLYSKDFQMLFIENYQKPSPYLSQHFRQNSFKLMQGRIRQFSPENTIKIFKIYLNQKKINEFYTQSMFIPLFKKQINIFTGDQIARILRLMMIIQNQNSERFYKLLYEQILKMKFKDKKQLQFLMEVIEQVKQIFTTHRVQHVLNYLREQVKELKSKVVEEKKKIHQIVKEDLIFFIEKRKIKTEQV